MGKTKKDFLWIIASIIIGVAILHLLRAVFNIPLIVGSKEVPVWLSYVAFAVLGYLGYLLVKHLKK